MGIEGERLVGREVEASCEGNRSLGRGVGWGGEGILCWRGGDTVLEGLFLLVV